MIGTYGASIIAAVNVTLAVLLGTVTGALLCLLFRKPWSLLTATFDAALSVVTFVGFSFAFFYAEADELPLAAAYALVAMVVLAKFLLTSAKRYR